MQSYCYHFCSCHRFPLQDKQLSPDHSSPPIVVEVTGSGLCHGLVIDMEGEELNMEPWDYPQVICLALTSFPYIVSSVTGKLKAMEMANSFIQYIMNVVKRRTLTNTLSR